jgi:hypothetical protein
MFMCCYAWFGLVVCQPASVEHSMHSIAAGGLWWLCLLRAQEPLQPSCAELHYRSFLCLKLVFAC